MRLKGRVALVTGGAQGIGAEIAKRFATEGARVAIVNRANTETAAAVVAEIEAAGGAAAHFQADLRIVAEIDRVAAAVMTTLGTIDILVNNAAIIRSKALEACSEADWNDHLDLNLKAAFFLARAVVPEFKRKGGGKIINVSSVAGVGGFPNSAPYCASKGGLNMLTKSLCLELARFGINVNTLSPGNIVTPMNEDLRTDGEWCERVRYRTPTGEDFLPAADMAGTAVFLASDDARSVHGANIMVDAGWAAW